MGWAAGQGLGKDNQGRTAPVEVNVAQCLLSKVALREKMFSLLFKCKIRNFIAVKKFQSPFHCVFTKHLKTLLVKLLASHDFFYIC